ncbi:MAG: PDZ domain-containing protein, partial [Muribaculaceae bacterium]|nr:PDZ domain-containing protein [Muribaculaceae bacterium]
PDLHVIPMGKSEDLHVGEWVLAVGNPFGFTSTVTSGIVSAKARNISSATRTPGRGGIESYIQTDAALNSGNSGGALVNLRGELVGINTAIYSQTGTYAGCSFAIPTSIVEKVIGDIHSFGTVQRAYLGVAFREVTPELVTEKGIKGTTSGVYVEDVVDRSAAREAGIMPADVIVAISGKPTRTTAELQEVITGHSPGDKVTIEFFRDGKKNKVTATLRNNKGGTSTTKAGNESSLGASFASIDEDTARRLEISHGVAVTDIDPDGRFAAAGMREGFIILSVNGRRINKPDEISAIYRAISKAGSAEEPVMFISGIYPTGKAAYYAVALDD